MSERYFRQRHRSRRRSFLPFTLVASLGLIFFIALFFGYNIYLKLFDYNIKLPEPHKKYYLYVPTGSGFKTLVYLLDDNKLLKDTKSFIWVSKKMHLTNKVHPGRFLLKHNMSNYELVSLLRSNANVPVVLVINNLNTPGELAGLVGNYLELDSSALIEKLYSKEFLDQWGIDDEQILSCFIPNTYEFYWNTNVEEFLARMEKEYNYFWNETRRQKANAIGLTPVEVSILASIVRAETSKIDEMPTIAGVYLNRLRKNMLLQADPTLKFAWHDNSIRRILNKHKEIESPYNTYKNKGLPPGPIAIPEIVAIDAVLNAEDHGYYYFCAKADLSGYHHFSTNYSQHLRYARQYQQALNRLNIRK